MRSSILASLFAFAVILCTLAGCAQPRIAPGVTPELPAITLDIANHSRCEARVILVQGTERLAAIRIGAGLTATRQVKPRQPDLFVAVRVEPLSSCAAPAYTIGTIPLGSFSAASIAIENDSSMTGFKLRRSNGAAAPNPPPASRIRRSDLWAI